MEVILRQFGEETLLKVKFSYYYEGGGVTAIVLERHNPEIGLDEIYTIATLYLPILVKLGDNYVAIKDYSENQGVLDALINGEVVEKEAISHVASGLVYVPIHKLTERAIRKKELNLVTI